MAAATTLFITDWNDPSKVGGGVTAVIVLMIWSLLPILFGFIIYKIFPVLDYPSVKKKFEPLYAGLNTDSKVAMMQPLVFSLRRTIFVLITFVLFDVPAI
jgi:hypothetical protein